MKKFVFAVQVFGVIALFPIYVILEMNQGLPDFNDNPGIEKVENVILHESSTSELKNGNVIRNRVHVGSMLPFVTAKS